MCPKIVENVEIAGSGKSNQGWFALRQANVYYDQPAHASMELALGIDFADETRGPEARVAVELSPESAQVLVEKIRAILGPVMDQQGDGEPEMCSDIIEKAEISGSGEGKQGWFPLHLANVYFDQPFHAPMVHALIINFVSESQGAGERLAVELSLESAREVVRKIQSVLEAGAA